MQSTVAIPDEEVRMKRVFMCPACPSGPGGGFADLSAPCASRANELLLTGEEPPVSWETLLVS